MIERITDAAELSNDTTIGKKLSQKSSIEWNKIKFFSEEEQLDIEGIFLFYG